MKSYKLGSILVLSSFFFLACGQTPMVVQSEGSPANGTLRVSTAINEVQIAKSTSIHYANIGGMPRYDQNGTQANQRKELILALTATGSVTAEIALPNCRERFFNVSNEDYLTLEGLVRRAPLERFCPVNQTCITSDAPEHFVDIADGGQTVRLNFSSGDIRVAPAAQSAIESQVDKILRELTQNSSCQF